MRARAKTFVIMAAAVSIVGGAAVTSVLLVSAPADEHSAQPLARPVWTEARWPFRKDQWGGGKAFRCTAADCGAEVNIYLRAKLGFCSCTTGVADDEDLDRMGDLDLIGEVSPLGPGRPISIASMKGRSRTYALTVRTRQEYRAISVVFNERCDMVAATAVLPRERFAAIEPSVVELLRSRAVLDWVDTTLGL